MSSAAVAGPRGGTSGHPSGDLRPCPGAATDASLGEYLVGEGADIMRTGSVLDPVAARRRADVRARLTRHPWLAALDAVMAAAAWAGVVLLVTGRSGLSDDLVSRLPMGSSALGGVALMFAVALPMSVAAVLAFRGGPFAAEMTLVSGLLLVGWVVVELAVIRTVSWLQPACAVYGGLLVVLGLAASPERHGSGVG